MKGQFVNPEEEKSCNKFVTKDDCGGKKIVTKIGCSENLLCQNVIEMMISFND